MLFQRGSRLKLQEVIYDNGLGVVLFQRGSRHFTFFIKIMVCLGVVLFQRGSRPIGGFATQSIV